MKGKRGKDDFFSWGYRHRLSHSQRHPPASRAKQDGSTVGAQAAIPPLQDAPIIDALLSEPMSPQLVQKLRFVSDFFCLSPTWATEKTLEPHEFKDIQSIH